MAKGCESFVDGDAMLLVERVTLHYLIGGLPLSVFSYVLEHVPFPVPVEGASFHENDTLVDENDVPEEVQSEQ